MNRRNFIKNTALASGTLMIPSFLKSFQTRKIENSRSGKNLVIIQLSGGNDGLNTIVPYHNDLYYKARPTLGIPKSKVLKMSDELGFHPALSPLQKLYKEGLMTIVNNVGYPNPDRSHFRSMDIWQSASDSHEYLSTGWLGRYLDSTKEYFPYTALELEDTLSLTLKGNDRTGFAMSNPQQIKRMTDNPFLLKIAEHHHPHEHDENVAYLYKTMIDTQQSAAYLHKKAKTHQSRVTYPSNAFGKDLKQVAELMTADTDTKIYYLSMTGFDTHANQANTQARLLQNYAEGLAAFVKDLKQNKLFDDTLIMTFSEFGRRVAQNASGGTDHGTASNVFLLGGKLKQKGFYNDAPILDDLDKGDLKYQVDFREIYASILDKWLESDAAAVIGKSFKGLHLF